MSFTAVSGSVREMYPGEWTLKVELIMIWVLK